MAKTPEARVSGCEFAIKATDPAQFSAIVNVLVSCEHAHIFVVDKDAQQIYFSETALQCIGQTIVVDLKQPSQSYPPWWVTCLISAYVNGTPIDFRGAQVPLSVQRELARLLAPAESAPAESVSP